MGLALWKRIESRPSGVANPGYLPSPEYLCRYRIEVFGQPRAPWRTSPAEAMLDAIRLNLASWDESVREYFLAVPVEMRVRQLTNM